jgi:hypothetical protein
LLYLGVFYKSFAIQELFTRFKQVDITVCETETEGSLVHNALTHRHRALVTSPVGNRKTKYFYVGPATQGKGEGEGLSGCSHKSK